MLDARILVMDDEPLIRLMICSQLERAGAQVSDADCCADALELVRNAAFDVAVFDARLPDGNGMDLVRKMRDEGFSLPVIMLSGEATYLSADSVAELAICNVFSKPPDVMKLIEAIASAAGAIPDRSDPKRIGRYMCFKVDSAVMPDESELNTADWLALDFSDFVAERIPASWVASIQRTQCGVAVIGANVVVREQLGLLDVNIEFATDASQLAALSRRPFSSEERASLLDVIITRQ